MPGPEPNAPPDGRWLNVLISALVALYIAFTWSVDAPADASEDAKRFWFLTDWIYKWCLYSAAAVLGVAALALLARQRTGLIVACIGEAVFALTATAMAIDLLVEPPMTNFITLIVLAVILFMATSQAREFWRAYRGSGTRDFPSPTQAGPRV